MVLGITEDFSWDGVLDKALTAIPTSGLYVNSGGHPSITVQNLLSFLPALDFTFTAWAGTTSYGVFEDSRNKEDIVTHDGKVWQSLKASDSQNPQTPGTEQGEYWLETNIESLRLKNFLQQVKDRVLSDLNLNKRLINNQFLYENGDTKVLLPNDYAAWVFEAKGSDYTAIKVNEISLQTDGTDPVNVYVINQRKLIKTIQVTPDNGRLSFQEIDLTLPLDGATMLAIDSREVYTSHGVVDPYAYDGFFAYTASGIGEAPESASYTYNVQGNGIGLNITAYLDASKYIRYNLPRLGKYIRATFEYMVFQSFLSNPYNRSNRESLIRMDETMLVTEVKNNDWDVDTVASRYRKAFKQATGLIEKTFDTQLNVNEEGLDIDTSSV